MEGDRSRRPDSKIQRGSYMAPTWRESSSRGGPHGERPFVLCLETIRRGALRCVPVSDVDNIPCSESTCALKCIFGSGPFMESGHFIHRPVVPARLKEKKEFGSRRFTWNTAVRAQHTWQQEGFASLAVSTCRTVSPKSAMLICVDYPSPSIVSKKEQQTNNSVLLLQQTKLQ